MYHVRLDSSKARSYLSDGQNLNPTTIIPLQPGLRLNAVLRTRSHKGLMEKHHPFSKFGRERNRWLIMHVAESIRATGQKPQK